MSDLYQTIIIEEATAPQNKGTLSHFDAQFSHTNASCGDEVSVQLAFSDDKQRVTAVAWQGVGCAISQAAMSFLSEAIKGKSLTEVLALQQRDMENLLGLDQITLGRTKCLMVGLIAVRKAIQHAQETK